MHLHTNATPPSLRERAWLFHCTHPRLRHRISFEHPCNIPASLDHRPLPPTYSTVSGGRVCWRLRRRGRKGDIAAATASPSIHIHRGEACARGWEGGCRILVNQEIGSAGGGGGDVLVLCLAVLSCRLDGYAGMQIARRIDRFLENYLLPPQYASLAPLCLGVSGLARRWPFGKLVSSHTIL